MPTSWNIDSRLDPRAQQGKQGLALAAEQIRDVPSTELEAALTTDDHPLFRRLQEAVQTAVGVDKRFAAQIVVSALELELMDRGVL